MRPHLSPEMLAKRAQFKHNTIQTEDGVFSAVSLCFFLLCEIAIYEIFQSTGAPIPVLCLWMHAWAKLPWCDWKPFPRQPPVLQKLIACVMTSQTTAQTTRRSQICTLVCVHETGRTVISFCSDKSCFLAQWMCWVLTGNHNWLIGIYQTKSDTAAFPFSNSRCGFKKDWALMAKQQALVVECLDFSFPIQCCKYWAENGQQSQPSSW